MFARMFHVRKVVHHSGFKLLYFLGFMIFFWGLFDSSFSYMVPLVITQSGYSKTIMGFILGSSSLFGALFDLYVARFIQITNFRKIYLYMFLICLFAPLFLLRHNILALYVIAMAMWGVYFDLNNIGNLDFVSRKAPKDDHSFTFGIIWLFRSLAYTVAPLIIGVAIGERTNQTPYYFMYFYLVCAIAFFIFLLKLDKKTPQYMQEVSNTKSIRRHKPGNLFMVGKKIFPFLLMTLYFWMYDAFFWTLGPIISESFHIQPWFSGFFMVVYTLPAFILGFSAGVVTKRFGKKKTAYMAIFLSGSTLSLLFFIQQPWLVLSIVTVASSFVAYIIPSVNGWYSDYILKIPSEEKEIESIQDFFTNLGYIIGPVLAGFLSDRVGSVQSFSVLGMIGVGIVIFILLTKRNFQSAK